jgi:hypothetical protein
MMGQGSCADEQWMAPGPLVVPLVWQTITRPDTGSWNQTALCAPAADTPIGVKRGLAEIGDDCARSTNGAAMPAATMAATASRRR